MTNNEWQPKEDFEKHGTQVIAWLSSDKGFKDMTERLIYFYNRWHWYDSHETAKRPDLINGVVPWPEPGEKK